MSKLLTVLLTVFLLLESSLAFAQSVRERQQAVAMERRYGDVNKALDTGLELLKHVETFYGSSHHDYYITQTLLGSIYKKQKKYDIAEQYYLSALAGREKIFGTDIYIQSDLINVVNIYIVQEKHDLVIETFSRLIENHLINSENPSGTFRRMANYYIKINDFNAAESYHLKIIEEDIKFESLRVRQDYIDIAKFYETNNKPEEAIKSLEYAQELAQQCECASKQSALNKITALLAKLKNSASE